MLTTNLEHEIASYIKIGTMRNHKEGVFNPSFFCWSLSVFFFDYPVSQATFFTSQTEKGYLLYWVLLGTFCENLSFLIDPTDFPQNLKTTVKTVIIQQ